MNNTRLEYYKRLTEIEIYFETLKLLDNGNCSIKCTDILGVETEQNIDFELSTILKANGYLLLYNLVEATVSKSIDAVLNSIHASSATYRSLSCTFRKLWIKQQIKNAPNDIISIADSVLENKLLTLKRECINISGNIDAQKIRDILKQIGGNEIKDGRHLEKIKTKRNCLAHGDFSFSEIGRDCTVAELIVYKDNAKDYLSKVLDEIEAYITSKKFLHADT